MTSCALVTEETAGPGEGATFCAIWSALPILSVCSPLTSMASGSPLMLPMMMSPPTSLRRRRLLGRSQEAVCEGGGEGEHLADLLGHRRCQRSPGDGRPRIASLLGPMQPRSKRVAALLSVLQRSHASTLLPGAPACRPWTDGRHEFGAEDSSHGVLRREVHRVTSPDGPLQRGGAARWDLRWPWPPAMRLPNDTEQPACRRTRT